MSIRLTILRHGPAGKSLINPSKDKARPLTSKGKKKVSEIVAGLHALDLKWDAIFTSPLPRANQTAKIVADSFNCLKKVKAVSCLEPGKKTSEIFQFLQQSSDKSEILLVGHEPGLTQFIGTALGFGQRLPCGLKKAGLVFLEFNGPISAQNATLLSLLTPAQLSLMGLKKKEKILKKIREKGLLGWFLGWFLAQLI